MQTMRDLLRSALGVSLSALPPVERLAAAWPVAAGASIAGHSVVARLEGTVVTVEVADRAWLQQLRSMTPQLRGELSRIARVPLTDILFEYKP